MAVTLVPARGDARPVQEEPLASSVSENAVIDIDVDVARDQSAAVTSALEDLEANVNRQLTDLRAAETQVSNAEGALDLARAAVEETEGRIDDLLAESDGVVIERFVNPPFIEAVDNLTSESIDDATVKSALLDIQADADAAVLAELDDTRVELEADKDERDQAKEDAEAEKAEREAELADLEAAVSQQAEFIEAVNDRLDRNLSEADALSDLDPELAARLRDDQADLAAKLKDIQNAEEFAAAMDALAEAQAQQEAEEAAAAAAAPRELGPASGSLTTVSCPGGSSITVDSTLGGPLEDLLAAAAADGVMLCGGGYRSSDEQVALRRAHCGTSDYAIYEMPSSQCSPPTARPGSSQHEKGLAIDFDCNGGGVISSHGSPCFVWLDSHGASYGLYNLPSEDWHWSTTGN
jgi:LAS superfamily LD-carboxypeptidase LdcB